LFFKQGSVVYNISPGECDSVMIFLLKNAKILAACINRYGLQSAKNLIFYFHSTLGKPKHQILDIRIKFKKKKKVFRA